MLILLLYISGPQCSYVWTGGWTSQPGKKEAFVWLDTADENGPSQPMIYQKWGRNQPNGGGNNAYHAVVLYQGHDYKFVAVETTFSFSSKCYICEW